MSRLVYHTTHQMKKNQIVFYLTKSMLWNGIISYDLKDNQGGPVIHLNLGFKDFDDENISWKLETAFKWLEEKDGKSFLKSKNEILSRKLEGARRWLNEKEGKSFSKPETDDSRNEYKVVFNNEYSFHGVAKQANGDNEEKRHERLYLPLNPNEIIAFGKTFFKLKLLCCE